eukprot:scaffold85338_cov17-Tisochrysis_lutea.AAC.1
MSWLAGGDFAFPCEPVCADDGLGGLRAEGESGADACRRVVDALALANDATACEASLEGAPLAGMQVKQVCPVLCGTAPAACGSGGYNAAFAGHVSLVASLGS